MYLEFLCTLCLVLIIVIKMPFRFYMTAARINLICPLMIDRLLTGVLP